MKLAIAHQTAPARGEFQSGDAAVIRAEDGVTLLALVDVLGHGPEAAQVAAVAVRHLRATPLANAAAVMNGLHDALRGTRGAAAAVCLLRDHRLDGCGVGNVEVRVLGSPVAILLTPGIVGQRMHRLREFGGSLRVGDRVVCFSDGIMSQTPFTDLRRLPPGETCTVVMRDHRRSYDDATVVIADVETDPGRMS
jgi:phosphoserine phosphatase RsbX